MRCASIPPDGTHDVVATEQVEACDCDGARQGIRREGVPVKKRVAVIGTEERVVHGTRRRCGPERQVSCG